jgi:hypothetical protein
VPRSSPAPKKALLAYLGATLLPSTASASAAPASTEPAASRIESASVSVPASERTEHRRAHPPTSAPVFQADAAYGVGWAEDGFDRSARHLSTGYAEVAYVETPRLLIGMKGAFESSERTFATTLPETTPGERLDVTVPERRINFGVWVGWDPFLTWVRHRGHRIGVMAVITAVDIDYFDNAVAPLVGIEPGMGGRGYLALVGPLRLVGGLKYQYFVDTSYHAATTRLLRARPIGCFRYDLRLVTELGRHATIDLRYAGEWFDFEHERTLTHAALLGFGLEV